MKACKKLGTFRLTTPAMSVATEIIAEVKLTAKSEWVKSVLNTIPKLSPQFTMQKQLNAKTKNIVGVRGMPTARSPRREKSRLVKISKGISIAVYWTKKASMEYAPSSYSR